MTNEQLQNRLEDRTRTERRVTSEILGLIHLAMERKIYLPLGYPSMFEWLTKRFGYSESAAYRRIEAARVLHAVPQMKAKLESGQVTLTSLTKASAVFRAQEKQSRKKISREEKEWVLGQIECKSTMAAEKTLISLFPAAASQLKKEIRSVIDAKNTRIAINLSDEVLQKLDRVRDFLASAIPNASLAQVIERIADDYLARKDPLRESKKSLRAIL